MVFPRFGQTTKPLQNVDLSISIDQMILMQMKPMQLMILFTITTLLINA